LTCESQPASQTVNQGIDMNFVRTSLALLMLAALGTSAEAHSEKAAGSAGSDYAEALRTGDVMAPGESGLKLNELYPQRYPHAATPAVALTRAQVRTELAEAMRSGEMVASGESGLKLNEEFARRYPAPTVVAVAKTRAQVNAETAEAIRTGDMVASGEGAARLNDEFPQRYARPRALYASKTQGSMPATH
jgi:hypothetical protein